MIRFLLANALITSCGIVAFGANATCERPNVVLMMADDQGWGETGYNGHPHLKTPVLDEMAHTALRQKISSGRFDAGLGHALCWAFSTVVLIVGLPRLASFDLTEPQLFFGILLLIAVALLGIILGTLLLMSHSIAEMRRKE